MEEFYSSSSSEESDDEWKASSGEGSSGRKTSRPKNKKTDGCLISKTLRCFQERVNHYKRQTQELPLAGYVPVYSSDEEEVGTFMTQQNVFQRNTEKWDHLFAETMKQVTESGDKTRLALQNLRRKNRELDELKVQKKMDQSADKESVVEAESEPGPSGEKMVEEDKMRLSRN